MRRVAGQRWQDDSVVQTEGTAAITWPSPVRQNADGLGQIGEVVTTIPTIGFNVESVSYKNLNFNVWVRTVRLLTSTLSTGH